MRIVLATGIYPPDIGGPATYVRALAKEFTRQGHEVTVVSYGDPSWQSEESWPVERVSLRGGPPLRWRRYASALQRHGQDADLVYGFSSVSTGVPLAMAGLRAPKKLLRLGGDFGWERYTDLGGRKTLRSWHAGRPWARPLMQRLLQQFDHVVFSTPFQRDIYREHFHALPAHSVIENAFQSEAAPKLHICHHPMRILFLGRLVRFKNVEHLIRALTQLDDAFLTIAGDGPQRKALQKLARQLGVSDRVIFAEPVHGEAKQQLFAYHDVLVLPSLTEISPNTALEARSSGLPVLLTHETGLSQGQTAGMRLHDLSDHVRIARVLEEIRDSYPSYALAAAEGVAERPWSRVVDEHKELFTGMLEA